MIFGRKTTEPPPGIHPVLGPVHDRLTAPGPGHPAMPVIPGMVDLSRVRENGLARCHACGWEGVPITIGAVYRFECPRCQRVDEQWFGKPDELGIDLSCVQPHGILRWNPRMIGQARLPHEAKPNRWGLASTEVPKVSRNAPCPCGSGLKAKKCCYA